MCVERGTGGRDHPPHHLGEKKRYKKDGREEKKRPKGGRMMDIWVCVQMPPRPEPKRRAQAVDRERERE